MVDNIENDLDDQHMIEHYFDLIHFLGRGLRSSYRLVNGRVRFLYGCIHYIVAYYMVQYYESILPVPYAEKNRQIRRTTKKNSDRMRTLYA